MCGQSCVYRDDAVPEVLDRLPYTNPLSMTGMEDDLSTVIMWEIRCSNDVGKFDFFEENGTRPYGCPI